jgi:amino acid permease
VVEQIAFKRNVGLFMAVMIGIGAMMAPGIFALPGELAQMVGPLGIFAYLSMGLLTVFIALTYSELGAATPIIVQFSLTSCINCDEFTVSLIWSATPCKPFGFLH